MNSGSLVQTMNTLAATEQLVIGYIALVSAVGPASKQVSVAR